MQWGKGTRGENLEKKESSHFKECRKPVHTKTPSADDPCQTTRASDRLNLNVLQLCFPRVQYHLLQGSVN